jgi:protoheme IX farnesyltransferase
MAVFRAYYELIKPGRTVANGMTALAGFLLAADGRIDIWLLLAAVGGTSLIVASACAFNNYFDRRLDSEMQRTKERVLVKGSVPGRAAVAYAAALGAAGFALLAAYTNLPAVAAGAVGIVDYLVFYGWSKRHNRWSTLIGSICGATPIVAGYTAATGRFDAGALLLFLIMVFWQMPHFYAIAIYRQRDYAAAHLPVWSVSKGVAATKVQIALFAAVFLAACVLLPMLGYASRTFLVVMGLLSLWWLVSSLRGFKASDSDKWARGLFGYSLLILMIMSGLMAVNPWLP